MYIKVTRSIRLSRVRNCRPLGHNDSPNWFVFLITRISRFAFNARCTHLSIGQSVCHSHFAFNIYSFSFIHHCLTLPKSLKQSRAASSDITSTATSWREYLLCVVMPASAESSQFFHKRTEKMSWFETDVIEMRRGKKVRFMFLFTCYATLHPALSVHPSVGRSVALISVYK